MAATTQQLHAAGLRDRAAAPAPRRPGRRLARGAHLGARRRTRRGELGRLGAAQTRAEARAARPRRCTPAGIDVDLAPVADTLAPGGFLGSRSFGCDASSASASSPRRSSAALQAGGVAATAKHFPGLGAARQNTDDHAVSLPATDARPVPHARSPRGVKLVMVSNASYPRARPHRHAGRVLAPDRHRPAARHVRLPRRRRDATRSTRRRPPARRMHRRARSLPASTCCSTRAARPRTPATSQLAADAKASPRSAGERRARGREHPRARSAGSDRALLEPEPLERRLVAAPVRPHLDDRARGRPGWPSSASISGRARVPISLTIEPPLPTRICFCDSVSTRMFARSTFSSSSSTSTEIACGTSSRVSHSAFSRTSSAICASTGRSVRCSAGK